MKHEWPLTPLDELCEFIDRRGVTPEKLGSRFIDSGFRVISAKNVKGRRIDTGVGEQRFVDEPTYRKWMKSALRADDVLLTSEAPLGEPAYVDEELEWCLGQRLFGIRTNKSKLCGRFLFYALQSNLVRSDLMARATGATAQGIRQAELRLVEVPLPPLAEQQRIVGVLDEAFAGLATANANAGKNLQNARALFESHLQSVFTHCGPGWVEKKLSDVCSITSSLVDPRKWDFIDLTHVGAGNIESFTGAFVDLKTAREEGLISGKFVFDTSMVLYSKIRPYLMKVARPDFAGLCSADMYPLAPIPKQANRDFLFHLLLTKRFTDYAIQGSARAGMPKVNREHLFEFKTWWPPVETQAEIAARLDALAAETQNLASIYERKLAALEELKKSLLHQAFTGELTRTWRESKTVSVLATVYRTALVELHAGIIAMGFRRHEACGKAEGYGHVKAEKFAHLVEAHAGVDLERTPVKDAAGPVDKHHLKAAEEFAEAEGYFQFHRVEGGGYRVTKLEKFDELVTRTQKALGRKRSNVAALLDLMVEMDRHKAELVATIFAAWNNLLLDGADVTDERIVWQAREEWHPDKMRIERPRFFEVISWMKREGLVPVGKGKKVLPKPVTAI